MEYLFGIKIEETFFLSIIIMYIVLTFDVMKIKGEKKDHTNTAPYHFFISSKAID